MTTNNNELEDRIHAAQVRSAYRNSARGLSATGVAAILLGGILGWVGAVSWTVAIAFSIFMLLQVQARLLLITAYHVQDPPDHEWRLWERRFTVGTVVGGFGLGAFSWFLLQPDHVEMQLLVMLFLCAVAGGAVTAFAVLRPAIYFAVLPALLVPTLWMMVQNDWPHWAAAVIVLCWLTAITSHARSTGAWFDDSVRRRLGDEAPVVRPPGKNNVVEDAGGVGAVL